MARRKKHSSAAVEEAGPALPAPAPRVGTSLGSLLEAADRRRKERPAPRTDAPPPILPAPGPAPLQPVPSRAPPAPPVGPTPRGPTPVPVPPRPRPEEASALSPAEQAALHRAFAGARPIARPSRGRRPASPGSVPRPSEPPDPVLERAARERLGSLVAGGVRFRIQRDGAELSGLSEGTDESALDRLTGTGFVPEATLDLHGLREAEVASAVERFVREARRKGRRYVLLIHGKGHHSPDGVGVLGDAVLEALVGGGAAPVVTAFATPHPHHGGAGALAVWLR
jgi:DNA-nicking Smr family endonuclease